MVNEISFAYILMARKDNIGYVVKVIFFKMTIVSYGQEAAK
jgi:hypothetical protein